MKGTIGLSSTENAQIPAEIMNCRREVNLLKEKMALTALVPELHHFPSLLFVSFSDICNLKCRFCGREAMHQKTNGVFKAELFEQLVPYLHLVNYVFFSGHGEPTLHPKFFDIAEICKSKGVKVHLTTNATLLDDEKIDRLLDMGLDEIVLSLDSVSSKISHFLREGVPVKQILKNVENLISKRDARGLAYPIIDLHMVASRVNMHQMPAMVRFCKRLSIREIHVFNMIPQTPEMVPYSASHTRRFKFHMWRARRLASKLGVVFQYLYNQPSPDGCREVINHKNDGIRRYCTFPWQQPFLYKEGAVRPCCTSDFEVGNLHDNSLWEIISGKVGTRLRRSFATGDYFPDCACCGLIRTLDYNHVNGALKEAEKEIDAGGWTPEEQKELEGLLQLYQQRMAEEFPSKS
jgi:MoaA/NifB/PqqE/SkfB family radical SAM enzyme